MENKIKIGISTCILGEPVRFDGGHKHDKYVTQTLGQYFEWVSVCPEVELGLGTPRPTLRFELSDSGPRLVQPKTGLDLTDKMEAYAAKRVRRVEKQTIYGYILKSKSPSCGMERIKVYKGHGISPNNNGVGVFANRLMEAMPNLPVEEDGRLCDPTLRENWIGRVFAYHALRTELHPRPSVGKLVKFHTRHKFTVLSHCQTTYRELGRLVAGAKKRPISDVLADYEALFMAALKKRATSRKHVNVMQHMIGFFKKQLDSEVRQEILSAVEDYRDGSVPVIVPITLIKHYAKILKVDYLIDQSYLNPHPKELGLRSRI